MQSKITIEMDFSTGTPYIKVRESGNSDDLRDKSISFFRQLFGHTSSWCKVEFGQHDGDGNTIWAIRPITPGSMLDTEAGIMSEQVRLNKGVHEQPSISH